MQVKRDKIKLGAKFIAPILIYMIGINGFLYSLTTHILPKVMEQKYNIKKITTKPIGIEDYVGNKKGVNNKQIEKAEEAKDNKSAYKTKVGDIFGVLRCSRIGLDTIVYAGDSNEILNKGAGMSTYTKYPGLGWNSVIAGHRDTVFRPLRNIKVGDKLEIETIDKQKLVYEVVRTRIVDKNDRTVVVNKKVDMLTLYTCYPFNYIGHAPKRFIVEAKRVN